MHEIPRPQKSITYSIANRSRRKIKVNERTREAERNISYYKGNGTHPLRTLGKSHGLTVRGGKRSSMWLFLSWLRSPTGCSKRLFASLVLCTLQRDRHRLLP